MNPALRKSASWSAMTSSRTVSLALVIQYPQLHAYYHDQATDTPSATNGSTDE